MLAMLGPGVQAFAATLQVGQQAQYREITQALAAAQPGDTIEVGAGEYAGALVIAKPVKLLGHGQVQLKGSGKGDVVLVVADDVELSGFSISGGGSDMMHSDAGIKVHGARATIRENSLTDNLFGVYLGHCEHALVEGNRITGRRDLDMGSRGAGVHLYDARHNSIRNNEVSYVRDGVYFDHADDNLVEDNEFHDLRYGVHYMYCNDNRFYRNVFRDSVAGAAIMYTERVVFSDNQILSNRDGYNAFGLLFQACSDCVAERNVIVNNTSGIFMEGAHHNILRHNLVAYNDVGVVLYGSAEDNTFAYNDFVGNLATLHTVGDVNVQVDWNPAGAGNYYGDYAGYDLDGDGVGDVPERLQDAFAYLEGNHPLLRLFLSSAAADALVLAEQSFPLIPASTQIDCAPRVRPVSGVRVTSHSESAAAHSSWPALLASLLTLVTTIGLSWRLAR